MVRMRRALLLLGLVLLLGAWDCGGKAVSPAAAEEFAPLIPPGTGLFGSHEFRSSLRALPQWLRVMQLAQDQVDQLSRCNPDRDSCSAAALSWQKILHEAKHQSGLERLKAVNTFFNRWPYRLDIDVYGKSEYWATPHEFLRLSGDCEDYSITKYYALKQLGVPIDNLRIVMLYDTIRGIAHAVLAVKTGDDYFILDNLTDMVLSHKKYEHYQPQYSVNERYRWAHVSPDLMRRVP